MKLWKTLILIFTLKTNVVFGTLITADKIVALANHHIILDSDVKNNIYMIQNNLFDINNNTLKDTVYYQQTLNQLITDSLIFQVAAQEEISMNYNQINNMINCILNLYNMTPEQFRMYLHNIGLSYEKYYLQQYKYMLKKSICEYIIYHRANISISEINKIAKETNSIDFNKQFKLRHIIFSLPIQPTQNQIDTTEYFAKLLIKKKDLHNNIKKLIHMYSDKNIVQIIKVQETEWISWKDIPAILDKHLQKTKKGDVIGPIISHDGIHVVEIQDVRNKQIVFPVTKVKVKILSTKDLYSKNKNVIKQLLRIKKYIENSNNVTLDIKIKEKLKDICFDNYEENIIYKDLHDFDPSIQKILISLKENEISIPVHTSYGWCLIQLINISILDYTEIINERAYLYLLDKKFSTIMKNWIQELRSSSYIKIIN